MWLIAPKNIVSTMMNGLMLQWFWSSGQVLAIDSPQMRDLGELVRQARLFETTGVLANYTLSQFYIDEILHSRLCASTVGQFFDDDGVPDVALGRCFSAGYDGTATVSVI